MIEPKAGPELFVIDDPLAESVVSRICYVTIGNSDDKLTQQQWASFCYDLRSLVEDWTQQVHGNWVSAADSCWQNACMCFVVAAPSADQLQTVEILVRSDLRALAAQYGQDSIALVTVPAEEVQLITP